MIDYVNNNGEAIQSPSDLPIADVNVVTFLIKVCLVGVIE